MKHPFSALLLTFCLYTGTLFAQSTATADSTKEKNIALYKAVTKIFNSNNFDHLDKYVDENIIEHTPDPSMKQGLEGLKEAIGNMRRGFPDLKYTIIDIIADKETVWAHINMKGTNTGSMMGMPPTNKKVDANGVDIIKIKNGKATEHWGYFQERIMMEQLGLLPGSDGANGK